MITNRIELAEYFANLGFTKGCEVGTADGRYSEILCQKIKGLELIAVDPFYRKGHEEKARERLKPFNVTIEKMTSMEAVRFVANESLDFVFIDANHSFDYVMEDIINWSRKVKSGGIVSGHDYYHFVNSGVIEAVNKYCEIHRINLNLTAWDNSGYKDDKCPCWWFVKP
jgi:predicted O-methyltransferase YrrM